MNEYGEDSPSNNAGESNDEVTLYTKAVKQTYTIDRILTISGRVIAELNSNINTAFRDNYIPGLFGDKDNEPEPPLSPLLTKKRAPRGPRRKIDKANILPLNIIIRSRQKTKKT